ncbi:MAG TPA: YbjN domain-containing protein [Candidatus Angelobacter sp.]|nr:YbjN domain-containing protein [Candidatus Angelobacter sp.]
MTPREAAVATVERVLRDHPEIATRRLGGTAWALAIPGTVRLSVPVGVEVGESSTTFTSFLLRGPRTDRSGDPAALHRLLLRKNQTTHRLHFALDRDDDVVLTGRLPTAGISGAEVEAVLAETLTVSESAFESLVHLGYPGVFPPLPPTRSP